MNFKIKALTFLVLFTTSFAFGQAVGDYRSHAVGPAAWNAVGSWDRFNGSSWISPAPSVPTTTDGVITIQTGHTIQVPSGSTATADQIVINGTLRVLDNGNLTVSGASQGSAVTVNNGGILEKIGSNPGPGAITGTTGPATTSNTWFKSGAIYIHNFSNLSGNPVSALWDPGSEMQVGAYGSAPVGYTGAITIAGAGWSGNFATVRYNCPNQANGLVNFAGLLTSVQKDLIIEATTTAGTGRFVFNSTGTSTTTIGGTLDISGPSRVWLATTGSVNVSATDLNFNTSIAGTSQVSGGNAGTSTLTINGTPTFSGGNFTVASTNGGTGNLIVNNANSLFMNGGTLAVAAAGTGTITLNGGGDFNYAGGTLSLATTGSGTITINNSGNFLYSGSGNMTYASTGSGNLVVNGGDFSMTGSGTMTFETGTGSGTLTLAGGNLSVASGVIQETGGGTGTIAFTGATTSTIDAAPAFFTIGTVGFNVNKPGGTLTVTNNNLTIAGTLTMNGGSLDIGGQTLTLSGAIAPNDWSTVGSNLNTSSASTLIIQTAGAFPTNNMAIQNGALFNTFTMNRAGTLPINGTFTVTTLNLNNGTLTSSGLTMADGGSVVRSLAAAVLTNHPNAAGTYDVNYTNAAAITAAATYNELPLPANAFLRDLNKSGAGAITFPVSLTSLTINRNLSISAAAGVVTGTANQTITVGGDFSSLGGAPTFGQAGSTFVFSNTTAFPNATHTLSGTGAPTFTSLTVNGTVNQNIGMTLTGTGNLVVNSGSTLTSASGTTTNFSTNATTTTVTNAGTLNLNSVSVNGSHVLLAPGASGNALGISGNFSTAGTFTANGGTVIFNGTSSQALSASEVYNNVTVNSGATVTSAVGQTINGTFNNHGIINFSAGTLTLGASSITTLDVSPSSTTVAALTLTAGTASITANGPLSITGVLTINAGASISASATSSVTKGAGNFVGTGNYVSLATTTFTGATTLSGAGTKTFKDLAISGNVSMAAISYTVNGNITGSGTLGAATGAATATFGGAAQSVSIANASFRNLIINNGSTVTAATNITNTGNFTINGAFVHGNKTVTFTTAGAHSISGNPTTFFNLTIGNGAGVVNVTNALAPLSLAGALNINGTTANTFTTGGSANFILLSTGDVGSGTDGSLNGGSIGPITGTAVLSGAVTVQRHMDSEGRLWRYIASPVVGATVANLQNTFPVTGTFTGASTCSGCVSTSPSLYFFDVTLATPAYSKYPTTTNAAPLVNGTGYSAYIREDIAPLNGAPAVINFPGTHPVTGGGITLTTAQSLNANPNLNWSLVGNPYPSAIVWDPTNSQGTNGWTGTTSGSIGSSLKITDNGSGGAGSVYKTISIGETIAAGQAFWVQTTVAAPTLVINENAKTSAKSTTFYRVANALVDKMTIQLTKVPAAGSKDRAQTDEAYIKIQEGSLNTTDYFDSPKWHNKTDAGINVFDLSTLTQNGDTVTINAIPALACSQQIKLSISHLLYDSTGAAETSANYSLTFNPTGGLKALQWTLHDNYTGSDIDVSSNPTYAFNVDNSNAATKASKRFYLVISSPSAINTSSAVTAASSVCAGTDAVIKVASQPGMTYAVEVNGLLLPFNAQGDGNDISIFIPSDTLDASNTIRVKANSGCDQQFLTQTVEFSTENFATAQAANFYRCSTGTVTLIATGAPSSGSYKWYADSTSTSPIFIGASFETPSLSDTTIYYVSALNNTGCEGDRTAVQAQIGNNGNSLVISQPQVTCSQTQGVLVASGALTGGSYRWYDGPDANAALLAQTDTLKQILYKPTTFYLSSMDANDCESNRISYMADVWKYYPVITPAFSSAAICPGGTMTVTASTDLTNTLTYRWYATASATTPLKEDLAYTTGSLTSNTDFYVSAVSSAGCESSRQVFTVPVNTSDPSSALSLQSSTICTSGGTSILASAGSNVSSINWYDSNNVLMTTANEFDTPSLTANTTFSASAVDQFGCEGTKKSTVVTYVNLDSVQVDSSSLKFTVTNYPTGNYQWYLNDDLLATETNAAIAPKVNGLYSVRVTSQGCSIYSKDLTFSVTGIEEDPLSMITLYPNPASTEINVLNSGVDSVFGQIYDMAGRPIKSLDVSGGQTVKVDARDLSSGMYIFKFSSEKGVSFKKAIIR